MLIVKVGGGDAISKLAVTEDIKTLGGDVVFVHGGRRQADQVARELGSPTKRIVSPSGLTSVLTDKAVLDILTMVYAGLVNKQWVSAFQSVGLNAIGLSGADGRLWLGVRKQHIIAVENGKQKLVSGTYTGKVLEVNSKLVKTLLDNSYVPVITQPAVTSDGTLINTDNDRTVAVMAKALGVKKIVVLFEAPGFLKDVSDPLSVVSRIKRGELMDMMRYAEGSMKKKVLGAIEAFSQGVETIYWGDGRIDHPVREALAGKGTVIQ
ncbi:[LysW]-aminoadipate kinase [Candidatus Gottesmanbacteria bacterium]|nr:[LysW]-aminoadipate kinase [Candidatus Gottesmanbacteria bacterium]